MFSLQWRLGPFDGVLLLVVVVIISHIAFGCPCVLIGESMSSFCTTNWTCDVMKWWWYSRGVINISSVARSLCSAWLCSSSVCSWTKSNNKIATAYIIMVRAFSCARRLWSFSLALALTIAILSNYRALSMVVRTSHRTMMFFWHLSFSSKNWPVRVLRISIKWANKSNFVPSFLFVASSLNFYVSINRTNKHWQGIWRKFKWDTAEEETRASW